VFFYSADGREPPHVHVQRDLLTAKVWLSPVSVAAAGGYTGVELRQIIRLIERHQADFIRSWNAFFKS
jgi:hypothetical protein